MKKLLLSAALFASFVSASFAQLNLPTGTTGNINGGNFVPVVQGMTGTYEVAGALVPRVSGSFTSATVNASLTATASLTYANDLCIMVTEGPSLNPAETRIIQIGGFSNLATNKLDWPCAPACDTNIIGTLVTGTVNFAAIDFTNTSYVLWLGNGYTAAGTSGTWNITQLTLGGTLVSIEESLAAGFSAVAYPNPASDVLNITVEGDEVVSVAVIAMDGKVVSNNNGSNALVADLTAGMYIYEARTASGAVIRNTFVKK